MDRFQYQALGRRWPREGEICGVIPAGSGKYECETVVELLSSTYDLREVKMGDHF